MSSTPTGKRGKFYQCCTDPDMGFVEHYHPSMDNPNWDESMEVQFRAQLSEQGYVHEILAEFGTQDAGVFNKDKLDIATQHELYMYEDLTLEQKRRVEAAELKPINYIYEKRAPMNPFRTMGVDWDKYQASSSIIILDYDINKQKFIVIKRVEVPRAEYSYDKAIQTVVELNDKYNPSWIFADKGAGEYQIERLHIIGDKRPSTGLKNKVVGWQFKENVEIIDPITKEVSRKPMKPFMVNQLQIVLERENLMLSPFDEVLYKQLIDYEVVRVSKQNGMPVFTDKNEHFIDALGLAFLAFVLNFPELVNTIEEFKPSSKIENINKTIGQRKINVMFNEAANAFNKDFKDVINHDDTDHPKDRPRWIQVPKKYKRVNTSSWGNRSNTKSFSRSLW